MVESTAVVTVFFHLMVDTRASLVVKHVCHAKGAKAEPSHSRRGPICREEALNMLEAQESDPFVAEPTDEDLIVPEATLEALRAGSPVVVGEASSIDTLHAKGLRAVEKLGVKDCVQLLRRWVMSTACWARGNWCVFVGEERKNDLVHHHWTEKSHFKLQGLSRVVCRRRLFGCRLVTDEVPRIIWRWLFSCETFFLFRHELAHGWFIVCPCFS